MVPADAERATAPESDDKVSFTSLHFTSLHDTTRPARLPLSQARFTAMLFGNAKGKMGPVYAIIKCSVKGVDLTSARVLVTLHHSRRASPPLRAGS